MLVDFRNAYIVQHASRQHNPHRRMTRRIGSDHIAPPRVAAAIARRLALWSLLLTCWRAATEARAQQPYRPTIDSLSRAQDSIIDASLEVIMRDSTSIEEYQKIIAIYKSRKRFSEELALATQMASANPASSAAAFAVGDAQLDNGAPDLAIPLLNKALLLEPTFVRARVALAEAYTMLRATDTALAHLDTAVAMNPRYAQAQIQRGILQAQLGHDSAAAESYRAAAELLPDSYGAWMRLARGLMKINAYDDAIQAVEYVMTLDSESSDALYIFAEAHLKLGHREQAAQSFEQFMLRYPTDRRALEAERIARELNGQ